jgi:UDP-GlcNAc:undecaprenyl-phosphate GlcNAc-1-phosphate transferase
VKFSIIVAIACIGFGASLVFTAIVRAIMQRLQVMDRPADFRKAHRAPVAYEGGLAMHAAFIISLVSAFVLVPTFYFELNLIFALVIGATATVALGSADDLMDLRPYVKLAAQICIGAMMFYGGFRIDKISNPFGGDVIVPQAIGLIGTVFWYALLMNGINMIDGLDGLATGIVGISALTLFAIGLDLQQSLGAALALMLFAICAGFLPFNFSPASIFMGDAGSLLLGFLLASITLLSSSKAPALLALLVPMLALGLPLFDTVFAFLRRTLKGQHPFRADRRHLHHRFLLLGFSEKRTVLIFYYITAYFGVTAYVLQRMEARSTLLLVIIITAGLLVAVENMRYLEKRMK